MSSPDRTSKAIWDDFQAATALKGIEIYQEKNIDNILASANREEQKRQLLADSEPPVHFDNTALKKLALVKQEFLKGVVPSRAFFPVRRLLARLAADERGEELEVDVWEIDPKGSVSNNSPSMNSLGHAAFSLELEDRDRRPQPPSDQCFQVEAVAESNKG